MFEDLSYDILAGTLQFPLIDLLSMRLVNTRFKKFVDAKILPCKSQEVFAAYIKLGSGYGEYVKDEGWRDFVKIGFIIGSVALSVFSTVRSIQDINEIPSDAR